MEPKSHSEPAFVAPAYHIEDLDEPMKHIVNALNKMAINNPPCDSDAEDGKSLQDVPEAMSKTASRVTGTEDALAELIRITFIHTNMIKNLQATNDAFSKQLEAVILRLNQVETEFRELRDAQAIEFLPQLKFRVPETTIDEHVFKHLPRNGLHNFAQPFEFGLPLTSPESEYDSSQWMDMFDIAATLAVEPQVPGHASSASSRSSNASYRERRTPKPHREEHVKRSRITYDGNGGQTPKISPTVFSCETEVGAHQEEDFLDDSSTQCVRGSVCSDGEPEEDAECSLTSWLYGKATKVLFRQ